MYTYRNVNGFLFEKIKIFYHGLVHEDQYGIRKSVFRHSLLYAHLVLKFQNNCNFWSLVLTQPYDLLLRVGGVFKTTYIHTNA